MKRKIPGRTGMQDTDMKQVRLGSPLEDRLRNSGIRPTRQRVALAELLFEGGDKHVTAEQLHDLAQTAPGVISLATVYNTLKQFSSAGLLREVATPWQTSYFDTNTDDHHHYFIESDETIVDIEDASVTVSGLPEMPFGKKVGRVDIIVHLVDE